MSLSRFSQLGGNRRPQLPWRGHGTQSPLSTACQPPTMGLVGDLNFKLASWGAAVVWLSHGRACSATTISRCQFYFTDDRESLPSLFPARVTMPRTGWICSLSCEGLFQSKVKPCRVPKRPLMLNHRKGQSNITPVNHFGEMFEIQPLHPDNMKFERCLYTEPRVVFSQRTTS